MARKKKYSVLLAYPDGDYQTYYAFVEAYSPTQAIAKARIIMPVDKDADVETLLVIRGHHYDQHCKREVL